MPKTRLDLHEELCTLLGSRNVYFQPPTNVQLKYPCIVYNRNGGDGEDADNLSYTFTRRYQVTFITKDPDSDIPTKIKFHFPCRYGSDYITDNLYHSNFDIYY